MIEQKVIIKLSDEYSNYFGTLTISAMDYSSKEVPKFRVYDGMTLKNIPISESPDNATPIIFYDTRSSKIPKLLMFLEETEYQVLFESDDDVNFEILGSLTKINKSHFKPFRLPLSDNKKYKSAGTLNFRSYVGKSFLDVRKNGVNSIKIPIEVRSKKIDYFNQYSAMIADLSQHALSLIFELNSPLYQEFELDDGERETYYEDFMFLEYLFREENLPSIFEYLSKNLHSLLKNYMETVPISFAQNINQNTLRNIVSKPNNLFKSDANIGIVKKLNGHLPFELEQIKHEDIVDTPENRFFKYFLELIQDLIEKLIANPKKGYVNDQLSLFSDEIEYYLSNKFFSHISSMEYVPFNSQILQKKEGYREIFQYFLMLESSFRLSWDEINNQFKGFEKKLSDLYEYWCYFKMLKVLNDMSVKKINFEDVFIINKDNWSISIKKGRGSCKKFKLNIEGHNIDVQLFYNLKFSDKLPYISYSLPFKPDYTLLIKINDSKHYIHFDAKYRSELEIIDVFRDIGKEEKDEDDLIDERDNLEEKEYVFKDGDIYKMHTYKDSILKTEGAYVLYPGNRTKRFYESKLIIPSVGAFSLTPGNDDVEEDNLEFFINEVLKTLLFNHGLIDYEWDSADY